MKTKMRWLVLFAFVFTAVSGVQAIDMDGGGTSDGTGFYYFSDADNWGGTVPGASDVARLRYDTLNRDQLNVDVDSAVNNFVVFGVHAKLRGTNTLTANGYLNLTSGLGVDLMDSLTMTVENRIRVSTGTTEINLYNDSSIETTSFSFDAAAAKLLMTLNDNSSYIQNNTPQITENMDAGSQFVLNDSSSVVMSNLTAAELYDNWLSAGAVFYLNDTASITLQTSGSNVDDISTYNAAGYLVINGKTDAVEGVDYTYDTEAGILQAIPEPATLGLFVLGTAGGLMVRRMRL